MSRVRVERTGAVAWVRYSRPDGDLLDPQGLRELRQAMCALPADPGLRVVIFTGEPGRFPKQMDPHEALQMAQSAPPLPGMLASWGVSATLALFRAAPGLQRLLDRARSAALLRQTAYLDLLLITDVLERSRLISIAAIDGPAFGGGMELALACDFRFCSERSELAQPEVLAGVMAGFGATHRLPALVGRARALEILLLCEAMDAAAAERVGLVHRVLPTEAFESSVQSLADRLASRPEAAATATRRALRSGDEVREMVGVWRSAEAAAGLAQVSQMVREELDRPEPRPLPALLATMAARSPGGPASRAG